MTQTPRKPRKSRSKAALTLQQMQALAEAAFLAGDFFFQGMAAAAQDIREKQLKAKEESKDGEAGLQSPPQDPN